MLFEYLNAYNYTEIFMKYEIWNVTWIWKNEKNIKGKEILVVCKQVCEQTCGKLWYVSLVSGNM